VSVFPCSVCRARPSGKLASLYAAWFTTPDKRRAVKQRLCAECFKSEVTALYAASVENGEACPSCHAAVSGDDASPIYLTLYLPGREPVEMLLPLCDVCAVTQREQFARGAQPLADRGAGERGPSPQPSPTNQWDAIGLQPVAST
jgi:hypothetical protein